MSYSYPTTLYVEASQLFRLSDQHKTNCEYWALILMTLNDEVEAGTVDIVSANHLRRQYVRLLKRNRKRHKKLLKVAERTLERYHQAKGDKIDGRD